MRSWKLTGRNQENPKATSKAVTRCAGIGACSLALLLTTAMLLVCSGCGLTPAWAWQRFERCNCGRVVDVREIENDKCRQCGEGWKQYGDNMHKM